MRSGPSSFTADRSVIAHELAPGTVRRIARFAGPHRKSIAVFLSLVIVEALFGAATPLVYKAIVDDAITPGRRDLVIAFAAVLGALALAGAALSLAQRWYSARLGEQIIVDLRTRVFDHVQMMPIGFFSRAQTGALVSRLNTDVLGAQQAFTSMLSNVVGNVFTVALTLTAMAALSWQVTILAVALLPLFIIPARWAGKRLGAIRRESHDLNGQLGQLMTERFGVSGALTAKLFGSPERESALFAERANRVADIGVTSAMYARVLMVALGLIASLATVMLYGVGGLLAIGGSLGIGTLVALTAYLQRLYGPLTSLSNLQVDVMTTLVSFERVFEVLDLQPNIAEPAEPQPLDSSAGVSVELDDVRFRYPTAAEVSLASLEGVAALESTENAEVLRGVSIVAGAGEHIALVGASGAGKSTIAQLVTRLYDPNSGAVRLNGIDVRDLSQATVRAAVGMVAQDVHLFHDTLAANLRFAKPDATDGELVAALTAAQVWHVVERMPAGLDTVVGDRGHRLSGGEKQRISIARLLLKNPEVVVLDEATAHLDNTVEAEVQAALDAALVGRTSIVIAHRLSTVRNADRIYVLDAGRVVESGTHAELLEAGGAYAELAVNALIGTLDTPAVV
ncbi:MAG: ABC transporter ATP-binding protein [Actinobacteria bacterium]|nr:ABC transporter ATP-binding protein [Actinomycetota bacterium]